MRSIVVATQHWHSPYRVGSHHIAKELQKKGSDVLYITAPTTCLHWLTPSTRKEALARRYCLGKPIEQDGILCLSPFALLAPDRRPILRSRVVIRTWWRLAVPPLLSILAEHGFTEVDLLYCDNPYQAFWTDIVRYRRFVFRVPDDLAGFPGSGRVVASEQRRLASAADRVVFAGHELRQRFSEVEDSRALIIPNGVSKEAFAVDAGRPELFDGLCGPIAIYVGSLDRWFDASLLREVALLRPDITFVVVGPDGANGSRLGNAANLIRLSGLPFEQVVAFLQHADVGLIPFDVRRHRRLVDAVHPLKLYEYMAAGLPVVTVNWAELEHLQPPVEVVQQNAQSFAAGIDRALTLGAPPASYREFLAGASWHERLQPLFRYLDEELQ
jgi:glycosyltransferase involved in cell wall biosynthesis